MLDTARQQRPKIGADAQGFDGDPLGLADGDGAEVDREARIDGSADAADRHGLSERIRQLCGKGRAHGVLPEDRPGPEEEACRQRHDEQDHARARGWSRGDVGGLRRLPSVGAPRDAEAERTEPDGDVDAGGHPRGGRDAGGDKD